MIQTNTTKNKTNRIHKWKWALPMIVFIIGCTILGFILYNVHISNRGRVRTITELNAMTYA